LRLLGAPRSRQNVAVGELSAGTAGTEDTACRPPAKGPVKVRAVGEYIIRDGDGRDISDEVVVERAIKWSA
jgi:hypothetical protein